jgi:hypothetical protein
MDPPSLLSHAEIVALNEAKRLEKEQEKAEETAKLAEQEAQRAFSVFDIIFIRHGESDGNARGLCQVYPTPVYIYSYYKITNVINSYYNLGIYSW